MNSRIPGYREHFCCFPVVKHEIFVYLSLSMIEQSIPLQHQSAKRIGELSILLPSYNNECYSLVKKLHGQVSGIDGLRFEIIVADDGSTDRRTVEANRPIDELPGCSYVERPCNVGRAGIRNFLARSARYAYLLFIDSDMNLCSDDFVGKYLACGASQVVYGSYVVLPPSVAPLHNLRYVYEYRGQPDRACEVRRRNPHHDFHTSNFLIRREVMLAYPFDERFRYYGYEDVFFGRVLQDAGIPIEHIDNPTLFDRFETNADFLAKTEEALQTLAQFSGELQGYSRLLSTVFFLRRHHLGRFVTLEHRLLGGYFRRRLLRNIPSMTVFKCYKLGFLYRLMLQTGF